MKARIKFRKYGVMKFIGHLDVMRFFQKVMRRAEIPIAFTEGYSPHMIMSFAQPLGVGITSDGEYLDIELTESISSKKAAAQMNAVMVEGIEIVGFTEIPEDKKSSGMTITAAADYRAYPLETAESSELRILVPEIWKEKVSDFLSQDQIIVWKKTKKSEKEVDIRPLIYDMRADEDSIYLFLAAGSSQNLKPDLVMETFFKYMNRSEIPIHYHRLDIYAADLKKGGYISLGNLGNEILE